LHALPEFKTSSGGGGGGAFQAISAQIRSSLKVS
jgi:hypothetical protein